jgi:hypothetical protein
MPAARPSAFRPARLAFAVGLLLAPIPSLAGPAPSAFEVLPWNPTGAVDGALFGRAVAPAGDVNRDGYGDVIVGAPYSNDGVHPDNGAAFLYLGSALGLASTPAWSWNPAEDNARAGWSVAPAGDVNADGYDDVLIGVPGANVSPIPHAGKVAVFHGGPGGLPGTPNRELIAPLPRQNGQQFGYSVSTAGDVNHDGYDDVLVGAPEYSDGIHVARGWAHVYYGGASGVSATPARTWLGVAQNGRFGYAVSTAGDFDSDGFADILISAPYEMNTLADEGRVSLYYGDIDGLPINPSSTIYGGSTQAFCGQSVGNAGDVNGDGYADVLIGLPGFHDVTHLRGMADLYFGAGTGAGFGTSVHVPDLTNNSQPDEFGLVVATVGDVDGDGFADIAVRGDHLPANDGRIAIYGGGGPALHLIDELTPAQPDGFGFAFASTGDTDGDGRAEILVGRPQASVEPDQTEGSASLYRRARVLPAPAPGWPLDGPDFGGFGSSLAILPKFEGGGTYPKLVIGHASYNDVGRISMHQGVPEFGVLTDESHSYLGTEEEEYFGDRLVDAGDMNHDGRSDLVVSSTQFNGGGVARGKVQFFAGASGPLAAPVPFLVGDRPTDRVGSALAGRGDVNGDGYQDLLVGARECDSATRVDCGKVWLFLGSANGPVAGTAWTREGDAAGRGLGASVALGDLDADGYSDVIVGSCSPEFVGPQLIGRVEVHYGGPNGPSSTPGLVLTPLVPTVSFGETVAALGDVTGDGICDLGVGSPRDNSVGRVDLYRGTRGRSQSNVPFRKWIGTQADGYFGGTLCGGGDVDGDGYGDFVIGEPGWDGSVSSVDEGRIHLFHGSATGPQVSAGWTFASGIVAGRMSEALSPLADVNADGFADLAVGMPRVLGRVYIFLGGGGVGRPHNLVVEDPFGTLAYRYHPARLGPFPQVQVGVDLISPGGRGKMTDQYEVVPANEPFTGVPNFTGATYFESSFSGSRISSVLNLPWDGVAYRIRGRTTRRSPWFPRSRWITPETHTSGDHDVWSTGVNVAVPGDGGPTGGAARILAATPNPSGGAAAARVSFALPRPVRATLALYDVRGARVATLAEGPFPAGRSEAAWNGLDARGRRAPAGVYFVVLAAEGGTDRMRLVRLP